MTTVPAGTMPDNRNPEVPAKGGTAYTGPQFPAAGNLPPIPGKPSATTGPGGPSISIPKTGKPGK